LPSNADRTVSSAASLRATVFGVAPADRTSVAAATEVTPTTSLPSESQPPP
jgi:hypothetical protein